MILDYTKEKAVYYGREGGDMSQHAFNVTAGVIFLIIAVLHAIRLFLRWEAVIGGWTVPVWISGVAIVVSGYLAYTGLRLRR